MIIGEFADVYPPQLDGVGMVVNSYCQTFYQNTEDTCYYVAPNNPKVEVSMDYPVVNYIGLPIPHEAYRFGLPTFDLSFQKQLRHIDFDIIHSHTPFSTGFFGAYVSVRKNIPLVSTFHSKYYDDFLSKTKSEALSKFGVDLVVNYYRLCDEVWTVNDATADVLREYGYDGKIVIMPNGTNLWYPTKEDQEKAEKDFQLLEKNTFLFVGQHNFKKNTRHILEATKLYAKENQNFQFVFVGQGPDEDAMKQLAKDLGIEGRCKFLGHIMDREVLMGIYAKADVLVFPSIYDNAPMVVREAAASGTPAIVVEGSCAAEGIEDNTNGYLCQDSPESICEAMKRAIVTHKEVGEKARETIPMDWNTIILKVRDRYEYLIQQYQSGEKKRSEELLNKLLKI